MFSSPVDKTITIRMPAQTVKCGWHEADDVKTLLGLEGAVNGLTFQDFTVNQRLDDRPQEFLGNDVDHLRAHFVQDALHHSIDQRGVRRLGRGQC